MGKTDETQGLVGIILLWNQTRSLTFSSIDDIRVVLALRKAPTDIYCDPELSFSTFGSRLFSPFSPAHQASQCELEPVSMGTVGR